MLPVPEQHSQDFKRVQTNGPVHMRTMVLQYLALTLWRLFMKTYVYGSYMCVYSCVYASTKRLVCNVSLKEI